VLGRIATLHDFGAGDILEVRPVAGKTLMVPFTRAAVPDISLEEGYARVDRAAAGLIDDEDEAEDSDSEDGAP